MLRNLPQLIIVPTWRIAIAGAAVSRQKPGGPRRKGASGEEKPRRAGTKRELKPETQLLDVPSGAAMDPEKSKA